MRYDDWGDGEEADERDGEFVEVAWEAKLRETDAAILVRVGILEAWLPKSQMRNREDKPGRFASGGSAEIPEWLAIEKGLA
jgi:hypothetical protein